MNTPNFGINTPTLNHPTHNNIQESGINTPILNYLIHLNQKGFTQESIRIINWTLTHLSKQANLGNPTEINQYIANLQRSNSYKQRLTQVYAKFCEYQHIEYKRPSYPKQAKSIKIPTHEKLEMLISKAGKTMSAKLQLSLETGLRPVELCNLKVKDIDISQRLIYPTTAKKGNPRTLKISNALATLLQDHITRNKLNLNDTLFTGNPVRYGKEYRETRNALAKKLNDQTIRTIRLYDFRHYFATNLYHKTKDILYVKQQMGHKRIETTLIYTQLLNLNDDEWICKATTNTNEATQLIESGFEYVATTPDALMLFRKRK
ncbi:MAG: site-specific integrase [Candidatus Bathyarchaeia archaeon]